MVAKTPQEYFGARQDSGESTRHDETPLLLRLFLYLTGGSVATLEGGPGDFYYSFARREGAQTD
jgi:hypothetical protein